MNNTKIISIFIVAILVVGSSSFIKNRPTKNSYETNPPQTETQATSLNEAPTTFSKMSIEVSTEDTASVAVEKSFTLEEVATHSLSTDCWSAVNGEVYDLTSWVSKHPGGAEAISSLCGKDGSSLFNGQHGGDKRPESTLATFKVGSLK